MCAFGVIAKPGSGVYGDEHYHYRLDADGQVFAPQRERYRPSRMPQIQSTFPTQGDVRSLVILVQYTDVQFVTPNPQEAFYAMLNEEGYSANGGTGSARDYFMQNSYNRFRPTFDVYGPITLPHERAYYGGGNGQPTRNTQMIIDACDALENDIDWTLYDVNQDGTIDNIFVYYAGHNEAEGGPVESVWPHRGYVYTEQDGTTIRYYYEVDSKRYWLWDYACTSELTGESGKYMCGIGTFCHEFGHVLGLDDLYNTNNSETYTVGTWDIMCSGNYNNEGRTPPSYSAFERFILGWLTPEQLTREQDCLLEPITTAPKAYLMAATEHNMSALDPNPKEYWLLENRQRVGWDAPEGCLPGTGLLISHITWNKGKWNNNTPNNSRPMLYDICEAWYTNPYMSTPTDTYPGMFKRTDFYPTNNDNDTLYAHQLHGIQEVADINIAFHHGVYTGAGFTVFPVNPDVIHTWLIDGQVMSQQAQTFDIQGKMLQDTVLVMYADNKVFELSLDSVTWTRDTLFAKPAADRTYAASLYVRYSPQEACQSGSTTLNVRTEDGTQFFSVILRGTSQRDVLIGPVEAQDADQITPYGFTARWKGQDDAEQYALAVYRLENRASVATKNPQLRMNINNNVYVTDESFVPVVELEVKLAQIYDSGKSSYKAWVKVEGHNDSTWITLDSIAVRASSSTLQRNYTFRIEEAYRQFRFRYIPQTGTHAVTLTSYSLHTDKRPVFLWTDTLQIIDAPLTEWEIGSLQSAQDYYYYLHSMENKGCAQQVSTKGNTVHVRTLPGTANTDRQFSVIVSNDQVSAYLPRPAEADCSLGVYTPTGTLLFNVPVQEGDNNIQIPSTSLVKGQLYLVKYRLNGQVKRKGLWSKFIY